jgi:hypothetical protein
VDLRVVVYERQVLPLRFRESRSGCGIQLRRRLDRYGEGVFSKTILDPDLEKIHLTGQDGPQRPFVRTIKVVPQFRGIRARTRETRERDCCVTFSRVDQLTVVLTLYFDGLCTDRQGVLAEILQ